MSGRESAPPTELRASKPPSSRRATGASTSPSRGPAAPVRSAADCLAAALRARTPASRAAWARRGLDAKDSLEPELEVLLLRQIYLAYVEGDRLGAALEVAERMGRVGPLRDIAAHDRARVLWARDESRAAIDAQRHAMRLAPPDRRSFHATALATFLHFSGDHEGALRALERAARWSHRDRPLIRAYRCWVELDDDRVPEGLEEARRALAESPLREGYGQFILGMIALNLGDRRRAAVHLRAFLRKNASADRAKALTLREEIRRARKALSEIESD